MLLALMNPWNNSSGLGLLSRARTFPVGQADYRRMACPTLRNGTDDTQIEETFVACHLLSVELETMMVPCCR